MITNFDCNGKQLDLSVPNVMGILNITPDSFYDRSRVLSTDELLRKAEQMVREGAAILDLGAVSTRPGAADVDEQEEMRRMEPAIRAVKDNFPEIIISIDTFRSVVAEMAIDLGAGIINDIYAGSFDLLMIPLVIRRNVPYIMMHMKGTPATMQTEPHYENVFDEVFSFFEEKISQFPEGYKNIIIDPGFGFGKTVAHNFILLEKLKEFRNYGFPVLAGLSRKSMVQRPLKIKSIDSLNGTTVLNTIAILNGASILRVHDVKEAVEVIRLVSLLPGDV